MFRFTQRNTRAVVGNTEEGKLQGGWPTRDSPTYYKERLQANEGVGLVCGQTEPGNRRASPETDRGTDGNSEYMTKTASQMTRSKMDC